MGWSKLFFLKHTWHIQKRAIRIVNGANYNAHTEPLFKKCNQLKVFDLHEFSVVMFMYDYVHNNLPVSFQNMFMRNSDINQAHSTRQSSLLYVPKFKNTFVSKLPPFLYPKIWNKWKQQVDTDAPSHVFKYRLKCELLASYSNKVACAYHRCNDCHGSTKVD